MHLISDYFLIILAWIFSLFVVYFSFRFLNKKNAKNDTQEKKDIKFFKISIFSIVLFGIFDSSLYMKKNIDQKLLNNVIVLYETEGFHIITNENDYCQIPNSIIYLNHKGEEVTKNNYSKKMCI